MKSSVMVAPLIGAILIVLVENGMAQDNTISAEEQADFYAWIEEQVKNPETGFHNVLKTMAESSKGVKTPEQRKNLLKYATRAYAEVLAEMNKRFGDDPELYEKFAKSTDPGTKKIAMFYQIVRKSDQLDDDDKIKNVETIAKKLGTEKLESQDLSMVFEGSSQSFKNVINQYLLPALLNGISKAFFNDKVLIF